MVDGAVRFRRLTEWWRPKAGVLVSLLLFYLAIYEITFQAGIELFLYSILTLTGFAVTGYVLNDWADVKSDRQAGKSNSMEGLSVPIRILILGLALVVTSLPWVLFFEADLFSYVLIAGQLALLVAYPIPPMRLKRFPFAAAVTDALYAFTLPAVLAWHTFDLNLHDVGSTSWLTFVALVFWMLPMGLRQIINHHVADRHADRITGSANISLVYKPVLLQRTVQNVLFPIELLGCLFFIALAGGYAGFFHITVLLIAAVFGYRQFSRKTAWFNVSFSKTKLDSFSTFWLGFVSSVVLVTIEMKYVLVAFLFVLLFSDVIYHPVWDVLRINLNRSIRRFVLFPFQLVSLILNWSLYYFRKWFLGWSEERNWGEHYEKRLADLALNERKSKGVIAVFNQNHNKYTETFVQGHLDALPFHTIGFHGWPSPMHVGEMESLLSANKFLQKAKYLLWKLTNKNVTQKENELIANRLIDEKASVILAEFGTMGNRMVEVSKMTGIPLVVTFYGYDAWHKKVLEEQDYSNLFQHVSKVIGVSQDICTQLIQLGCPKEKVVYIPCYVNTELFKRVDRDFSAPNILSVGRFTNTKAPQLTILAFNEVLKSIPDATLTMIGADDDNASFEASTSLLKALDIEDKVKLKGVCTPEEVYQCMSDASIFVQHSVTTPINRDKEGTPVAIMEALATGLPVVSTKHAGIQEIIQTGVNGILVNEFDYQSMASEMVDLLNNKEKLQAISSAAVNSIRNSENIQNHNSKMEEVLLQTMSGK